MTESDQVGEGVKWEGGGGGGFSILSNTTPFGTRGRGRGAGVVNALETRRRLSRQFATMIGALCREIDGLAP